MYGERVCAPSGFRVAIPCKACSNPAVHCRLFCIHLEKAASHRHDYGDELAILGHQHTVGGRLQVVHTMTQKEVMPCQTMHFQRGLPGRRLR
jgi:hypothetical protein